MSSLSEMFKKDAQLIADSKKKSCQELLEEDMKVLGEDRIQEIRKDFLPMIGKEGFHYSLKTALSYIEDESVKDYGMYKKNFLRRFNKRDPFFRKAKSEDDYSGKYIVRTINKSTRKTEIFLSADGFKQFCASQNTLKASAVREYFVRMERERFEAVHASPEENKVKAREDDRLIAEFNERINSFISKHQISPGEKDKGKALVLSMDKQLSANINNLIRRMEALDYQNKGLEFDLHDTKIRSCENAKKAYDIQCRSEEFEDSNSLRARASAIIRTQKMTQISVYLIDPIYVKKNSRALVKKKSNKKSISKKKKAPNITKSEIKKVNEMLGISSDEEPPPEKEMNDVENKFSAVSSLSEKKKKVQLLYEPGLLDWWRYSPEEDKSDHEAFEEDNDDEYELTVGSRSAELYAKDFQFMQFHDLDLDGNYFFAINTYGGKSQSDKKIDELCRTGKATRVCVLDVFTSKHLRSSTQLLGNPRMHRPVAIYFTTWREVKSCADRVLCRQEIEEEEQEDHDLAYELDDKRSLKNKEFHERRRESRKKLAQEKREPMLKDPLKGGLM